MKQKEWMKRNKYTAMTQHFSILKINHCCPCYQQEKYSFWSCKANKVGQVCQNTGLTILFVKQEKMVQSQICFDSVQFLIL